MMIKRQCSRIYIHAPNIHNGGGKALLYSFISSLPDELDIEVTVDNRMLLPSRSYNNIKITKVNPTVWARLSSEWRLRHNAKKNDLVVSLGNLPPLFNLTAFVIVFLQNRLLIDDSDLNDFPFKIKLRLLIERFWLSKRLNSVDEFLVQTPSMKSLLLRKSLIDTPVKVTPYVNNKIGYKRQSQVQDNKVNIKYDFVYVASGEPHKNHKTLIEAWCILSNEGVYPSLCLTVSEKVSPDLYQWIKLKEKQCNLKLYNMGQLPKNEVDMLYGNSSALIYPSVLESFGIPLIEARQAGLSILAPELDYVRDILDPDEVFEPHSAISITRAVKRFLKINEPELPLLNAHEFIEYITNKLK